jgi:predicted nucleic acid-binding protein
VLLIMARLQSGEWVWLGSEAIDYEVYQTPDPEKRHRVEVLATAAHQSISLTRDAVSRAQELQALGFKQWDALHLACAERGQADIFLTTDDKFLRLAERIADRLRVRVNNPLTWLEEVTE